MKIINKIATVFFVLFGVLSVFATETPPDPPATTAKGAVVMAGPPNPPAPIDGAGLLVLILAAILLGIYVIYNHKLKTKASV
ncbi:hypothetical protein [Flavobacterium pectinovorum]|uniref:hypothetical protein n=1 Tax=Flavobacterium pectinovorum TaxID=29533 RepID=UPI001FACD22C|nr:hypothetical protein [Flavobacterium pectinovorum]MCI9844255.1 hypothetical protein [Flavobacterium pectinovorum]